MKLLFQTAAAVGYMLLTSVGPVIAQETGQRQEEPNLQCLEQFDVTNDGDLLLLPVTLAGRRYVFVLDTGSDHTVYDRTLPLGRPQRTTTLKTLAGERTIELFDPPNASVGKLSLGGLGELVVGCDLHMTRLTTGHEIRGIIGMDFLSKYVVRINIAAGKVSFLRSANIGFGERLPILRTNGSPFAEVSVGGLDQPQRFLIDTGSIPFANMKKELVTTLAQRGKARKVGAALTLGLSGTDSNTRWLLDSLSVGKCEQRDVPLIESEQNVLGLGFWSGCIVTFDFPAGEMYLKKCDRLRRYSEVDVSGLHLLRIRGTVIVFSVDKNSPAAVSGLRPKDVILSIDNERLEHLSMFSLRRLLCSEGKRLSLTIARDKESVNVAMILGKVQVHHVEQEGRE
jgi:hypothetical protein